MNLKYELSQFIGTLHYHRLSVYKQPACTDGIKYLAVNAEAFWLVDYVGALIAEKLKDTSETFFVIELIKNEEDESCVIRVHDGDKGRGNGEIEFSNEKIDYTTFPIDKIEMYLQKSGDDLWVLMLTTEY